MFFRNKNKKSKKLVRLDRHENILQDMSSHVLGHCIARLTTKTFQKIHRFQIQHKKKGSKHSTSFTGILVSLTLDIPKT